MKKIILAFAIIFFTAGIVNAVERITDNCYKFDGVLVCEADKPAPQKEIPKIEAPKKEDESPIVKTTWEDIDYSDKQICNAIWYAEGKEKANQEYGINPKYVKCDNHLACENVCLNTVKNKRKTWNQEGDFLEYLSKKYCPPNHSIWLKNLRFWLKKLTI